jgi:hypothetical protein
MKHAGRAPALQTQRGVHVLLALCLSSIPLGLGLFLLSPEPAFATNYTVGIAPCSSTIQACIDLAANGDTIIIPAGTYNESLTLNKAISLTGALSTTTLIHAIGGQRVITVTGSVISNSVIISGLTFYGGNADVGGGIVITNFAGIQLTNVVITNNVASQDGGGIYIDHFSAADIYGSKIISNTATSNWGGGIYNNNLVTLTKSIVYGNTASNGAAGGIFNYWIVTIISTTVQNNRAIGAGGGGIAGFGGSLFVTDSTFLNNDASPSGGGGAISISSGNLLQISNSTFSNNTSSSPGAISIFDTPLNISNSSLISNYGGISSNAALLINNTTFMSNTGGGALSSGGTATVTNSRFYTNTATQGGGGIGNGGAMTLTNVIVSGNHSPNWYGGGIYNGYGTLSVIGGSITANDSLTNTYGGGGGIANSDGTVILSGVSIFNNRASFGGGIYNYHGGVFLDSSQVYGNVVTGTLGDGGGGLYNYLDSAITVTNSSLYSNTAALSNRGGAIANIGSLAVSNSTLNANSAFYGGAIYNHVTAAITNTTFYSNSATGIGGGAIYDYGILTTTNVTLAHNSAPAGTGGGINGSNGSTTLRNTILADSPTGDNCAGTVTSQGYNLDDHNTCVFGALGDLVSMNPLLGALAHNGGSTQTMALLTGSPAINHIPFGTNGCGTSVTTDQRGWRRPLGLNCDIGAYESGEVVYLPLIVK